MRRPEHLTHEEETRQDRLADLAFAVSWLRRAVERGNRLSIDTWCEALARRLRLTSIPVDEQDEIEALTKFLRERAKYIHDRLRKCLLPIVAAIERQCECGEQADGRW